MSRQLVLTTAALAAAASALPTLSHAQHHYYGGYPAPQQQQFYQQQTYAQPGGYNQAYVQQQRAQLQQQQAMQRQQQYGSNYQSSAQQPMAAQGYQNAPYVQAAARSGWYVTLHTGYIIASDHDFTYSSGNRIETELSDGFLFGASAGYDLGRIFDPIGIRGEFEVSFRQNDVDGHTLNGASQSGADGDVSSVAYMMNAYADWHTESFFRPYVGMGLGWATVSYNEYGTSAIPNVLDYDDTVFAYQGMIGASFNVSDGVAITTDYRYFGTGDPDLTTSAGTGTETEHDTHNFAVGVRYTF